MPARKKTEGGVFTFMGKTFLRPKSPKDLENKEQAFVDYVNEIVSLNLDSQYDRYIYYYNKDKNDVSQTGGLTRTTYSFPDFVNYVNYNYKIKTSDFLQSQSAAVLPVDSMVPLSPDKKLTKVPTINEDSSPQEVTIEPSNQKKFLDNLDQLIAQYPDIPNMLFAGMNKNEAIIINPEDFQKFLLQEAGKGKKKSFDKYTVQELKEKAKKRGIKVSGMTKKEIIAKLRKK